MMEATGPEAMQRRRANMRHARRKQPGLYLIFGDLEPEIAGPFRNMNERDRKALEIDKERSDEDLIFMLDIDSDGKPAIEPYSNGFFMEGRGLADQSEVKREHQDEHETRRCDHEG